jgi:hypothetical protein
MPNLAQSVEGIEKQAQLRKASLLQMTAQNQAH